MNPDERDQDSQMRRIATFARDMGQRTNNEIGSRQKQRHTPNGRTRVYKSAKMKRKRLMTVATGQ